MVRPAQWFHVYELPEGTGFRALDESSSVVVHALGRRFRSLSSAQRFVDLHPWHTLLVIIRGVDDSMPAGTLRFMVAPRLMRMTRTRSGSITWYAGDER